MATPFDAKTDTPTTAVDPLDKFTFGDVSADGWETVLARDLLPALEKARPVVAVTAAATATLGASHRVSGAGPFTLTLPAATEGDTVEVRLSSTFTNLLTLAGGSVPVGGLSTRILFAGESAFLRFDAVDGWQKIGGRTIPLICTMRRLAALPIPDNRYWDVQLDTTLADNSGMMADLTNRRINTVRPGTYTGFACLQFYGGGAPASLNSSVGIFLNGTGGTLVYSNGFPASASSYPTPAVSGPLALAVGDSVVMAAYQATGAPQNLQVSTHPTSISLLESPAW